MRSSRSSQKGVSIALRSPHCLSISVSHRTTKRYTRNTATSSPFRLLNGHTLGKISRLIHIKFLAHGNIVRQQLQRNHSKTACKKVIDFGDIHCKVCDILHVIIAVCRESEQLCTTALDFYHITDSFFIECRLCYYAEYHCTVLDQADRSVFQFACCICLRVNLADLFQFQTAFHTDCVVDATSNKECVLDIHYLGSKPLQTLFILQNLFDLFRDRIDLSDKLCKPLVRDLSSCLGKLEFALENCVLCSGKILIWKNGF